MRKTTDIVEVIIWIAAYLIVALLWQLPSIPFWVFGGFKWGASVSALLFFMVTVKTLSALGRRNE